MTFINTAGSLSNLAFYHARMHAFLFPGYFSYWRHALSQQFPSLMPKLFSY